MPSLTREEGRQAGRQGPVWCTRHPAATTRPLCALGHEPLCTSVSSFVKCQHPGGTQIHIRVTWILVHEVFKGSRGPKIELSSLVFLIPQVEWCYCGSTASCLFLNKKMHFKKSFYKSRHAHCGKDIVIILNFCQKRKDVKWTQCYISTRLPFCMLIEWLQTVKTSFGAVGLELVTIAQIICFFIVCRIQPN